MKFALTRASDLDREKKEIELQNIADILDLCEKEGHDIIISIRGNLVGYDDEAREFLFDRKETPEIIVYDDYLE